MWQLKGKGIQYKGTYVRDTRGERVIVLVGIRKDGSVHAITAESWQMLRKAGWVKL